MTKDTVAAPPNLRPVEQKLLLALRVFEIRGVAPTWGLVAASVNVGRKERMSAFYRLRRFRLIGFDERPGSIHSTTAGRAEAQRISAKA